MVPTSAEQCRITSPGQRRKLHSTQCARLNAEALDAAVERWMAPIAAQEGDLVANLARRQLDVVGRWRAAGRTPRLRNGCISASKPSKAICANGSCAWGTKPHETGDDLSTQPVGGPRRGAGVVTKGAECPPAREYGNTDTHRLTSEPSVPSSELHVGTRLSTLAARVFELENLNVCERRLDVGARPMASDRGGRAFECRARPVWLGT